MQVTRNSVETSRGPSDWFTGAVYLDDQGDYASWGEHVTDEEYGATRAHPPG